jgi:hypothetical protein
VEVASVVEVSVVAAGASKLTVLELVAAEQSPSTGTYSVKESIMAPESKRQEPDIPPQKPDIRPEPRPVEIPQDKDVSEKQSPPTEL